MIMVIIHIHVIVPLHLVLWGIMSSSRRNPCDENPCESGTCTKESQDRYVCDCDDGFSGINCDISICSSNPCQNDGECKPSDDSYTCICQDAFKGDNCETARFNPCDDVNNPCKNNGQCNGPYDGTTTCDCSNTGYTDSTCETEINE